MKLVFTLFLILITIPVKAEWKRIIADWESISLHSLQIFNDNLIVTVGDEGLIKISKDSSGNNWENIFIPEKVKLLSVACLDNNTLIAGSDKATLFKTTNLGTDWKKISFSDTFQISIIKFKNQDIGLFGSSSGAVYKTDDGGNNWVQVIEGNFKPIQDISITKDGDMYLTAQGRFMKSTNNGDTWDNLISVMGANENTNFYRVKAVSNNVIYSISDFLKLYKSTNSGSTWEISVIDSSKMFKFYKPEFAGFEFFDESNGIIRINDYSQFMSLCEFSTNDGGKTFNYNPLLAFGSPVEVANCMHSMTFKSNEYGFSCGSNGQITKIFIDKTQEADFFRYEKKAGKENDVFIMLSGFSDKDFAILNYTTNLLWITNDAGNIWSYFPMNTLTGKYPSMVITNITYLGLDNFIFTLNSKFEKKEGNSTRYDYKGYIFKTTGGGQTFSEYSTVDTLYFSNLTMVDDNYGIHTENNDYINKLFYTTNSGVNWIECPLPAGESYVYKCSSPEPGVFFIYIRSGESGNYTWKFFRTYDYGQTWIQGNGDNAFYTMKLLFIDRQNGFGVSRARRYSGDSVYTNHIWKTTDAGDTWVSKFSYTDSFYGYNFNDISVRGNTVLATRDYNYLCLSKDLGETWELEQPPQLGNDVFVRAATLLSTSNCLAIAPGGYILYYDEFITSVDEKETINYHGDVIFPNPATEYIEIQLSESSELSESFPILIYNILGECVINVGVQNLEPLRVDISQLPTGMYFVCVGNQMRKFAIIH